MKVNYKVTAWRYDVSKCCYVRKTIALFNTYTDAIKLVRALNKESINNSAQIECTDIKEINIE